MNLKDLFTDISGFAEFVPGIDANINLHCLIAMLLLLINGLQIL